MHDSWQTKAIFKETTVCWVANEIYDPNLNLVCCTIIWEEESKRMERIKQTHRGLRGQIRPSLKPTEGLD